MRTKRNYEKGPVCIIIITAALQIQALATLCEKVVIAGGEEVGGCGREYGG